MSRANWTLERDRRPDAGIGELDALVERLRAINDELWQVEDEKRAHERARRFHADFVALARRVYKENDQRAAIKREIKNSHDL